MNEINDFFTLESMLTLTGATGATLVVSNTVQQFLQLNPKLIAIGVAQMITIASVFFTGATLASDYFIAIINGFLVYSSAIGASTFTNGVDTGRALERGNMATDSVQLKKRSFLSPWI